MAVSALGHVTFLVAGLLAFASPAPLPENEEAIAVEVIDPSALNQITRGERKAEKVQEQPLPRAERKSEIVERKEQGEAKQDTPAPPTRPPELKVADDNASAPTPPPRPAPQPPKPEPKPAPEAAKAPPQKSEAQAAQEAEQKREELAKLTEEAELASKAKKAEEDAKAAAKAKAEADAKKADAAKAKAVADAKAAEAAKEKDKAEAEAAKVAAAQAAKDKAEADAKAKAEAEAKAKIAAVAKAKAEAEAKAKREAEVAKNFNVNAIDKLLQSKEPAQSTGSSAPQVNRTASLGTERGSSQKLSPSLRAQLIGIIQDQLLKCWNVPIGLANAKGSVVPAVRMKLNTDGSLVGTPGVINSSSDPLFRVAADSALTATRRCAPLRIPAQFASFYDDWRDVVVNFDARDVL
ncbi:cell envelope integrity protein TolA [Bosea caraganae]|uniref:Cell envelope integrity protein TolA n=1 Tax=Bosea caraganae TaxID=2763117 RepID=A0A370KY32_9HYPH|nr:cell envelope integrity protein TolA [Bosea caraganae]RDJ19887.1 cell envelope integrity protein TolA [Bosea caraganae]RDJ25617.1 cell envelope integrity protein TolA [Bosea caraganae]